MSADTAAFVRPAEGGAAEPEGGQCAEASMVPSGNPPFCHELGTRKMPGQGEALEWI